MEVPEAEIPRARALLTVIGGEVAYDAGAITPPTAAD